LRTSVVRQHRTLHPTFISSIAIVRKSRSDTSIQEKLLVFS
jgi:hypothetical protein